MSCNAWNHPPNCNCGWGGVFHGLGLTSGSHYWQKSESYTNPNATCPVCRAKVFYYESPYGGKVYFDQIGPPWAKHPCTDNYVKGSSHVSVSARKIGVSFVTPPPPQIFKIEDGWMPVYCFAIQVSDVLPDYLDFSLFDAENRKHLYAKTSRELVDSRSPILIRRIKGQLNYEISTLNVRQAKPTEIRLFAFTTIQEAEAHEISLMPQFAEEGVTTQNSVKRVPHRVAMVPSQREVLHVTNRNRKVRSDSAPSTARKNNEPKKSPSTKSLIAAEKRTERAKKREERSEADKSKKQLKTAFEIAFEEAKGNRS